MPERHPLERLLRPIDAPELHDGGLAGAGSPGPATGVRAIAGTGAPAWLHAGDWRVFVPVADGPAGEEVQRFVDGDGRPVRVVRDGDGVTVPFSLAQAYRNYVSEAWRQTGGRRALSASQLELFYRVKKLVPRSAQLAARRALIRYQGSPEFPRWPYDGSVADLLELYARCLCVAAGRDELAFHWFWPQEHRSAVILTHDVESAEGLRLAVEIADLEEARGLRSSFNVVADWYPVDEGVLRELRDRGFEVGVHGIRHDRSMFATREGFETQRSLVREAAKRFGATGFRSPATHRVFEWLGDLPLDYDATMPHSDPYEPIPGGCCSVWPFFIGSLVELPYTMPQDHTLFTLLRHRTPQLWLDQLQRIHAVGGLAQCVSHPDPGYLGDADKRALYETFLDGITELQGAWTALPREVARWWRQRDALPAAGTHGPASGRIRLGGDGRARFELVSASQPAGTAGAAR